MIFLVSGRCGKDWGGGERFLEKEPPRPAGTSRIVRDRLSRGGEFTLVSLGGEFSVDVVLCVNFMAYCCGHERDARAIGGNLVLVAHVCWDSSFVRMTKSSTKFFNLMTLRSRYRGESHVSYSRLLGFFLRQNDKIIDKIL
jgi:hypothetical protein